MLSFALSRLARWNLWLKARGAPGHQRRHDQPISVKPMVHIVHVLKLVAIIFFEVVAERPRLSERALELDQDVLAGDFGCVGIALGTRLMEFRWQTLVGGTHTF